MIKDAKNLTKKQIKEGQTSLSQDDFAPYLDHKWQWVTFGESGKVFHQDKPSHEFGTAIKRK